MQKYFEQKNPAALEEITAVMLEGARKGMWKPTREQITTLASRHVDLVNRFKPSCSGFVCNNNKLRQFIAKEGTDNAVQRQQYLRNIDQIREKATGGKQGMTMKKETLSDNQNTTSDTVNGTVIIIVVLIAIIAVAFIVRRNRKMR